MGRRRASIDWCPASPPCTHTHIDSPFLPCRATLFFQPSSTFFLPRFPIFQPRVIPFLLFLFARPSYFSFGREPRFSALHLSPTSVFAWNRRFYASCTPRLCLSFSSSYSLRFQTSFLSCPPTSNDQFFRSFVTSSKYSSIFRISPSDSQTHCQFRAFPSTNICKFDLVSVLSLLSTSFSLRTRA